jgi:hypothetical protein
MINIPKLFHTKQTVLHQSQSMVRVFHQSRLYGGSYTEPLPHLLVWPEGWLTKRRKQIARTRVANEENAGNPHLVKI